MLTLILGEEFARVRPKIVNRRDFLVLTGESEVLTYYFRSIWPNNYFIAQLCENKTKDKTLSKKLLKMLPPRYPFSLSKSAIRYTPKILDIYNAIARENYLGRSGIVTLPEVGFLYFAHYPFWASTFKEPLRDNGQDVALYVAGMQQFHEYKVHPDDFVRIIFGAIQSELVPRFPNLQYIQLQTPSTFEDVLKEFPLYCTLLSRLYTLRGIITQSSNECRVSGGDLRILRHVLNESVTITIFSKKVEIGTFAMNHLGIIDVSHQKGWKSFANLMAMCFIIQNQVPAITVGSSKLYTIHRLNISQLVDQALAHISDRFPTSVYTMPSLAEMVQKLK